MLQPIAESTIHILFEYNLDNIFQNVCFKSWYNTRFSAPTELCSILECLSGWLEHHLSVCLVLYKDQCLV